MASLAPPCEFNIVNLKQVVGEIHCVFIGERHVWPLAVHSLERCVWRSDLFFIGVFRRAIAESSRSRRGVGAQKPIFCGAEWRSRRGVVAESELSPSWWITILSSF